MVLEKACCSSLRMAAVRLRTLSERFPRRYDSEVVQGPPPALNLSAPASSGGLLEADEGDGRSLHSDGMIY